MNWEVEYCDEAKKDIKKLDGSQIKQVLKAIEKVSTNPLPFNEGGYGKPLGNKSGNNLTGYLKIKLRQLGIRVVYRLKRENGIMRVIVVSVREDNAVYQIAVDREDN
ncbi:MAG: type II toxin-antitoxin system RelE/ParE family toxin [Inconstantimicrobium porci]|uniref:type II toxin-antitoxin system RelE family toxin n=1 Tax=Inconstantimicrobium porci TaxID=2652291 RepID=UPI002A91878F|nr:type II toxin-antitoxin system RelE/ParE family toxin [Inconstantimicrobium porci]MDY5912721.1 type II toxin-antitoxin system RelE/ParE family toxin [Inconstantimicrobium porci]